MTNLERAWDVVGEDAFDLIYNGSDRIGVDLKTGKPLPLKKQSDEVRQEWEESYNDMCKDADFLNDQIERGTTMTGS